MRIEQMSHGEVKKPLMMDIETPQLLLPSKKISNGCSSASSSCSSSSSSQENNKKELSFPRENNNFSEKKPSTRRQLQTALEIEMRIIDYKELHIGNNLNAMKKMTRRRKKNRSWRLQ
jgi:hypothetical protein